MRERTQKTLNKVFDSSQLLTELRLKHRRLQAEVNDLEKQIDQLMTEQDYTVLESLKWAEHQN